MLKRGRRRGRLGHRQQFRQRPRQWQWRAWHRWHDRWHRHHAHFKHSLGSRLIATFLVLALLSSLILYGAISSPWGIFWAPPLMLLVTAAAFGMIRHLLWPLRALGEGAEAFGRGQLGHRIRILHRDELGDLAHRFNQMAADIQAMLDDKRALLLAISHELRSPLTRARLHAELLDGGGSKDALLGELAQMRDLIHALLESERLGRGHGALQMQDCEAAELLRELRGVQVDCEPGLPRLRVDPLRMQLLLGNLVANAQRHNEPARGPVIVSLRRDGRGVRLAVRDHGQGVPAEALPRLGEPFYRPDAARTRSDGGVGLGLSLCKLVAAAHGSRLELRNLEPGFEAALVLA